MSKLVNYGTGDIVDRITILSLKLLYGEQAGKETKHFRDERNALMVKLNAQGGGGWLEKAFELAAVNAALWQAEDELRRARSWLEPAVSHGDLHLDANLLPVVYIAVRVQKLNDRRAELISLINVNTGESTGQEKLT